MPINLIGSNQLFLKSYITFVNHSTIALLQDDSSNQSFLLHCNNQGYWNWSTIFSTWSMRNITGKFYRTLLFTVCNQQSVSLNLIIITDNINIIIIKHQVKFN